MTIRFTDTPRTDGTRVLKAERWCGRCAQDHSQLLVLARAGILAWPQLVEQAQRILADSLALELAACDGHMTSHARWFPPRAPGETVHTSLPDQGINL